MKKTTLYVTLLVALVVSVMNVAIWQKEQILSHGERVYLKLLPQDPRSIMQGDYMRLRYEVSLLIIDKHYDATHLVVTLDDENVGHFARYLDTKPLAENERVFKLDKRSYLQNIVPHSFFFQEGHASAYERAKYGIFTFKQGSQDSYLLTGLADAERKEIIPE